MWYAERIVLRHSHAAPCSPALRRYCCHPSRLLQFPQSLDASDVRAIAGSGVAGFADGPAHDAQFMFPTDLAVASDGTLYISDEGAQRIRALSRPGS